MDRMRAVRGLGGGLVECRPTGARTYEVTMTHIKGKERLLDGFKIGDTTVMAKELCNNELVVSFLNLPAYITDEEILKKLDSWGVGAASPIRRRMWPGTNVADGTRFLKVKFTEKIQSLPYSAKFETALGPEYFRVIHDRQVRVCRLCIQPGHILRDCPEFSCHRCGVQGHYARECEAKKDQNSGKCALCFNKSADCVCADSGSAEDNGERGGGTEDGTDENQHQMAVVGVTPELAGAMPPPRSSGQLRKRAEVRAGARAARKSTEEKEDRSDSDQELTCGQRDRGKGEVMTDGVEVDFRSSQGDSSEIEMEVDMIKQARRMPTGRKAKKKMRGASKNDLLTNDLEQ